MGEPATIRIHITADGRIHVSHRLGYIAPVEVFDDRPDGGYCWATLAPFVEEDLTPGTGRSA